MTKRPINIEPSASIHKASAIFKSKRVRHLVVVDLKGHVLGLISQTDVVQSFNRIYSNYQYLLWDPWLGFLFFVLMSIDRVEQRSAFEETVEVRHQQFEA